VIEFLLGVGAGIFVRDVGGHVLEDDRRELEAENHQLREGLRHVAGVLRHRPELPSLVRYIDKLLADEAGS
jgi:hypothetical protein